MLLPPPVLYRDNSCLDKCTHLQNSKGLANPPSLQDDSAKVPVSGCLPEQVLQANPSKFKQIPMAADYD